MKAPDMDCQEDMEVHPEDTLQEDGPHHQAQAMDGKHSSHQKLAFTSLRIALPIFVKNNICLTTSEFF
jgi:hypothetical protein